MADDKDRLVYPIVFETDQRFLFEEDHAVDGYANVYINVPAGTYLPLTYPNSTGTDVWEGFDLLYKIIMDQINAFTRSSEEWRIFWAPCRGQNNPDHRTVILANGATSEITSAAITSDGDIKLDRCMGFYPGQSTENQQTYASGEIIFGTDVVAIHPQRSALGVWTPTKRHVDARAREVYDTTHKEVNFDVSATTVHDGYPMRTLKWQRLPAANIMRYRAGSAAAANNNYTNVAGFDARDTNASFEEFWRVARKGLPFVWIPSITQDSLYNTYDNDQPYVSDLQGSAPDVLVGVSSMEDSAFGSTTEYPKGDPGFELLRLNDEDAMSDFYSVVSSYDRNAEYYNVELTARIKDTKRHSR